MVEDRSATEGPEGLEAMSIVKIHAWVLPMSVFSSADRKSHVRIMPIDFKAAAVAPKSAYMLSMVSGVIQSHGSCYLHTSF